MIILVAIIFFIAIVAVAQGSGSASLLFGIAGAIFGSITIGGSMGIVIGFILGISFKLYLCG